MNDLKKDLTTLANEVVRLKKSLKTKEEGFKAVARAKDNLSIENKKLSDEVLVLEQKMGDLLTHKRSLCSDIAQKTELIERQKREFITKVASKDASSKKLIEHIKGLMINRDQLKKMLSEAEQESDRLNHEVSAQRKVYEDSKKKAQSELEQAEAGQIELAQEISVLRARIEQYESTIAEHSIKEKQMTETVSALQKDLFVAKSDVENLTGELEAKKLEIGSLNAEITRHKQTNERVEALEQSKSQLRGELDKAQETIESLRKDIRLISDKLSGNDETETKAGNVVKLERDQHFSSSWNYRLAAAGMAAVCVLIGGVAFTLSGDSVEAIASDKAFDFYKPAVQTHIQTNQTKLPSDLSNHYKKPSEPVALLPNGQMGKAGQTQLEKVKIATKDELDRVLSLPAFLVDAALNPVNAQEIAQTTGSTDIDYPSIQRSLAIGERATQLQARGASNLPTAEEHYSELLSQSVLEPKDLEKLRLLSTQQETPNLSLKELEELEQKSGFGKVDAETVTYYGELMDYGVAAGKENTGFIPHSRDLGRRLGEPVPKRVTRFQEHNRRDQPWTVDDIQEKQMLLDEKEIAINAGHNVKHETRRIEYKEGQTNVIRVAKNNLANLSFLDKYGNPYPISDLSPPSVGELFTTAIKGHASEGSLGNVAEIVGKKLAGSSNISVLLHGRSTPAVFQVLLTPDVNDINVSVWLPIAAPGFEQEVANDQSESGAFCSKEKDSIVDSLVAGLPPLSVKKMITNTPNLAVYRGAGSFFIRTTHELITPSCDCIKYSTDDVKVCTVNEQTPILTFSNTFTDELENLRLMELKERT